MQIVLLYWDKIIDSKLCFNERIDKICKKLSKRIGILRKIRSYLPLKQRFII